MAVELQFALGLKAGYLAHLKNNPAYIQIGKDLANLLEKIGDANPALISSVIHIFGTGNLRRLYRKYRSIILQYCGELQDPKIEIIKLLLDGILNLTGVLSLDFLDLGVIRRRLDRDKPVLKLMRILVNRLKCM